MNAPAKRRTDPERAQSRRNQVLQAAALCFARSGFHGASMSEISKEAGMSAGHIYNYFDSKEAIIMAFVDLEAEHVTTQLRELESKDDPLQSMIDEAPRHIDENLDPHFFQLPMEMFAEAARNPKIAEAMRAADVSAMERFRPLIKRERERRGLAVDDALLEGRIDTLVSLFHGLPIRALHRPHLNRDSLIEGYRVALKALLLT
ncbi:TetR family transcriptional regulator [Duganella sp. CY15W]|uniref:TetR/AcrR family transcriptional regulator n=1 Tax=Duganella sp. CY15W TaxID=2692172 RepID=UPI00136CC90D|nr:TetR/AcrR family transcriptional regulator [Duganella sp. CY15W]MYM27005.1 TetR family transcriptional regulator [Duganella sp. CY15W]